MLTSHASQPTDTSPTQSVLLDLAGHLSRYGLADPVSVTARVAWGKPELSVQVAHSGLTELAAELLAWADTLHSPATELVRMSTSVHLHLTGRLAEGHAVQVYTSAPNDLLGDHAHELEHRGSVSLPLGTLRTWATTATGVIA